MSRSSHWYFSLLQSNSEPSAQTARARVFSQRTLEIICVAVLYIVTARLGQFFAIEPGNVTPIWIPSGIMLALVLLRGYFIWPGIFLGAFLGNAWAYADFSTVSMIVASVFSGAMNGLGDVLCAVGAAWFIKRSAEASSPFHSLFGFWRFVLYGVLLGPFVSAALGTSSLWASGFMAPEELLLSLLTWWTGDSVGVLLFSPALLVFFHGETEHDLTGKRIELAVFGLMVALASGLQFAPEFWPDVFPGVIFLMIPLLFWSLLRLGLRVTFIASLFFAGTAIIATSMGQGPFIRETQNASLMALQLYLLLVTGSVFIIASLITEKQQLVKKLQGQIDYDPLTRAYNRLYFHRQLDREILRLERYKAPFSLIMYDIDYFKQVNDTYGHIAGDEVLKSLTRLVQSELRDIDTLARWGGEEFMILMPETSQEGAYLFAERIRQIIADARFIGNERLTISLGVIEYAPHFCKEDVLRRLDIAMYESKDRGRNQTSEVR